MVGLYRGEPDSVERGRLCESDRWRRMDTGKRLSDQEKWVWMGGARLGMDLRDVTRFQGLMDAGWLDGWEKKESECERCEASEVERGKGGPLARKRRVAAETGQGARAVSRQGGRRERTR